MVVVGGSIPLVPTKYLKKICMIKVTLADGTQKSFPGPISVQAVAESIGPGLAKAALAAIVDGQEVDTSFMLEKDATLRIITDKDPEGLEVIRHSCAHLFAQAMKSLFPQMQISIGPVIEDGFYYDFDADHAFSEDDFVKIEEKMTELAVKDLAVSRKMLSRAVPPRHGRRRLYRSLSRPPCTQYR